MFLGFFLLLFWGFQKSDNQSDNLSKLYSLVFICVHIYQRGYLFLISPNFHLWLIVHFDCKCFIKIFAQSYCSFLYMRVQFYKRF